MRLKLIASIPPLRDGRWRRRSGRDDKYFELHARGGELADVESNPAPLQSKGCRTQSALGHRLMPVLLGRALDGFAGNDGPEDFGVAHVFGGNGEDIAIEKDEVSSLARSE